jgi:DNA helicase-2/ATP-dependent DNA helicase PcrA
MDAVRQADQIDDLTKSAKTKLKAFVRLMEGFSLASAGSVGELLKTVVEKTGYARSWGSSATEQAIEKKANVEELINAAAQYDEANADDPTLGGFLETTSLMNDDDLIDSAAGKVTLMTMHAAKGLEFPVVFIVGLEHGLIPHERSIKSDDSKQIEEERRLLFVGMTRAMKQLYLTTAQMRAERGTPRITIPSTFLSETEFVHGEVEQSQGGRGDGCTKKEKDIRERLKAALKNSDGPVITTGAALLAGTSEEAELPQAGLSFSVGMRVRHPKYGNGTVTEVSGVSKKQTVTVEFQNDSRSETFRAAFCPLQPVGGR